MALDLYVGTLTRYHCGDWETIGAQMAREQGIPFAVFRPGGTEVDEESADPEEVREAVFRWRSFVSDGIKVPLDWDESDSQPHFTDRPYWEGYASLLLWACYEEHPERERPAMAIQKWDDDPAFLISTAEGAESRYTHLLHGEYWLPADFPFIFHCEDVPGNRVNFGSAATLVHELEDLNNRTWKADRAQISRWRQNGCEPEGELEKAARYGFSIFLELGKLAVENRLVIKLDY